MTPSYDIVNYGSIESGYRHLCSQCFNREVAESAGLTGFENAKFEPVGLVDSSGEVREFHFRTHLFGTGVALDALELCDGHPSGYYFQIIGDPEEDLLVLLGRLIEKMRRALSTKHLTNGEHGLQISDTRVVRGRVEWDDARILCQGGRLRVDSVLREIMSRRSDEQLRAAVNDSDGTVFSKEELDRLRRRNIVAALEKTNWKIYGPGGAAEMLGVKPTTLSARVTRMGLKRPARDYSSATGAGSA